MELHEHLNICLLALESRYPTCVVEVNETLLGRPGGRGGVCGPGEMREVLRQHAPHLLLAPARLVIDPAQSGIYLADRSEEEPTFWVYCGGDVPD